MNPDLMQLCGLGDLVEKVKKGCCPFCNNEVAENSFRDDLSRREFKISGMCQTCQDRFFEPEEQ